MVGRLGLHAARRVALVFSVGIVLARIRILAMEVIIVSVTPLKTKFVSACHAWMAVGLRGLLGVHARLRVMAV